MPSAERAPSDGLYAGSVGIALAPRRESRALLGEDELRAGSERGDGDGRAADRRFPDCRHRARRRRSDPRPPRASRPRAGGGRTGRRCSARERSTPTAGRGPRRDPRHPRISAGSPTARPGSAGPFWRCSRRPVTRGFAPGAGARSRTSARGSTRTTGRGPTTGSAGTVAGGRTRSRRRRSGLGAAARRASRCRACGPPRCWGRRKILAPRSPLHGGASKTRCRTTSAISPCATAWPAPPRCCSARTAVRIQPWRSPPRRSSATPPAATGPARRAPPRRPGSFRVLPESVVLPASARPGHPVTAGA